MGFGYTGAAINQALSSPSQSDPQLIRWQLIGWQLIRERHDNYFPAAF